MLRSSIALGLLTTFVLGACGPATDSAPAVGTVATASPHGTEGVGPTSPDHADLVAQIDEIAMAPIREGQVSSISVGVVQGSDTIAIRSYGWADLELDVPAQERGIYEIGSVTKQFTSVAMLQLEEQGKLSLDDDLSVHLPDFPTRGNRIPLRRLLDHTSGMRGYTEMSGARHLFIQRFPHDSLVAHIAAHEWDFDTGEHLIYNNSAYLLAGLIIEKLSGETYEDYVEKEIFEPLGMVDSRYCSEREVQEGKVKGYEVDSTGLVHKGFIVHNVPYAAGSLCSTAWDLMTWLDALHNGRVLNEASYAKLIRPSKLNDGTELRYALGLATTPIAGHRAIHHGGGINGFVTQTLYLPDSELKVAVVVSTAGPPGADPIAEDIVKAVLGEADLPEGTFDGDLSRFSGTYSGPARGGPMTLRIAVDGDVLTAQRVGDDEDDDDDENEPDTLVFVGDQTFRMGGALLTFEGDGASSRLRFDVGYGHSVLTRDQ